jgi:hypothetical protein
MTSFACFSVLESQRRVTHERLEQGVEVRLFRLDEDADAAANGHGHVAARVRPARLGRSRHWRQVRERGGQRVEHHGHRRAELRGHGSVSGGMCVFAPVVDLRAVRREPTRRQYTIDSDLSRSSNLAIVPSAPSSR